MYEHASYQNVLETIGNTPVVRINRLAPQGVNLFVKLKPSTVLVP
jgi:cysteine synthase A